MNVLSLIHILLFPVDTIDEDTAEEKIPTPDTPILVYCKSGRRSFMAAKMCIRDRTTVAIRIPAWSEKSLLTVNGEAVDLNTVTKDGYAYITRAGFRETETILAM